MRDARRRRGRGRERRRARARRGAPLAARAERRRPRPTRPRRPATGCRRALVLRDKFRKTRVQPPREEGAEAWRALETGPVVLASVYLRDADVVRARSRRIDRAQARELLESERPQFAAALEAAAQEPSVARCIDLLAQLRPLAGREPEHDASHDDEDFVDDRDLFGAAAFARRERVLPARSRRCPRWPSPSASRSRSSAWPRRRPRCSSTRCARHPDARVASEALALTLDAMASEEDAGDPDAARRAFKAAQPLLAAASDKALAGKVHPSAARLRAAMGEIELREGRIDEARALLKQSADEEKSGSVLLSLARIEWRDGQTQPALDHLTDALSAQDVARDPALRGEILLLIERRRARQGRRRRGAHAADRGAQGAGPVAQARRAATRARASSGCSRACSIGSAPRSPRSARSRGPTRPRRATGIRRRRPSSCSSAGRSSGATSPAAREGLAARPGGRPRRRRSRLLRALGAPARAPAARPHRRRARSGLRVDRGGRRSEQGGDRGGWVATLARFGEGRIKGDELVARAATPIQKYEALFYSAMDRRASGDTKGGDDLLRQVVAGTGLELSEVSLARDMLDPTRIAGRRSAAARRLDPVTRAPSRRTRSGRRSTGASSRRCGCGRGRSPRACTPAFTAAPSRGSGVEFGGYREYVPGDDLRWLDRRSLLRHDRLVVRQFETETDRTLSLLVDASASMGYRGSGRSGVEDRVRVAPRGGARSHRAGRRGARGRVVRRRRSGGRAGRPRGRARSVRAHRRGARAGGDRWRRARRRLDGREGRALAREVDAARRDRGRAERPARSPGRRGRPYLRDRAERARAGRGADARSRPR